MVKKAKTKKQKTRQHLVKELDSVFSLFIRLRDCDEKGIVVCPLCWAKITRKQAQNMHFITRACFLYRYDEENCHSGCMRCNVFLNGNYIIYTRRMQHKYWVAKVDEMINNRFMIFKIPTQQLVEMIDYYSNKVREISHKKRILI